MVKHKPDALEAMVLSSSAAVCIDAAPNEQHHTSKLAGGMCSVQFILHAHNMSFQNTLDAAPEAGTVPDTGRHL